MPNPCGFLSYIAGFFFKFILCDFQILVQIFNRFHKNSLNAISLSVDNF